MTRDLQPRLPPAVLCHRHFREDPLFSAHTPDLSGPACYSQHCRREPVDTMCIHTGQAAQGAWLSSSPHLGLLLSRGAGEAKAVKPKKLLRRLRGAWAASLLPGSSSGSRPQKCRAWLPQAKSQVFHVAFQEEGQVLSSGQACQHQLWRVFAQMHAYFMYMDLAHALGHPRALGNGS